LKNSGCHGIAVYGTDGARSVTNLLIKNNEIFNCQTGWSECLALNGNVDGFEVSGNLVHDNNNIGIDFIGFEGECPVQANDQARNGICVDNRIYNITSKGNLAYGSEQSADGIYVDGGKNILIERNIIDLCDIGIELASEHAGLSTQDITVRNNFVSRSVQGNLQAGGYDSKRGNTLNCVFANNTCYQAKEGELVLQYFCKDITIINNIFIGLSGKDYLNEWGSQNTNIIVKNNLYWGASTTETGQWTDNLAIFKDPKLKNSYLDMHLSKESPAIDKAFVYDAGMFDIDKNQRIIGNSSDIGADEFDPYASVENPVEEQLISVYPNPAKDDFVIKIPGQIVFPSALMVYNVQGELIMTDRISGNIYSGSTMQLVGKGIYFLKVINPRFSTNMKLIVQ
jgi:hypothetical protein